MSGSQMNRSHFTGPAVRALAYVVIETRDLAAYSNFATQIMGLQSAPSSDPDIALFRMDERPFRFLVRKGETDRFVASGWELPSKEAYDAALVGLRRADIAVEIASAAEAKARFVFELARCADPSGNQLELSYGRFYDYAPFQSPVGVSGFISDEMGLGHVVLPAPKLAETRAFYVNLLGFGDSDQARFHFTPDPNDPGIGFHFLHCDNPRHHSLAIGEFPNPTGLIHLMVEVKTIDDVGRALDRAEAAGVHISSTLGRHTNDHMISFYMRSPIGFDVEYGCHGRQIDWATFTPTMSIADSNWGHQWRQPPQD